MKPMTEQKLDRWGQVPMSKLEWLTVALLIPASIICFMQIQRMEELLPEKPAQVETKANTEVKL